MKASDWTPYTGTESKLIVALDVGTTFSGVSYCILFPGHVPEVNGVTKFPDQDVGSGDLKVPSVIWYDSTGTVKAIGAGAVDEGVEESAYSEGWKKVEWFRLHLRPRALRGDDVDRHTNLIPPLPQGKTIVDVFGDFLRYLYQCTQKYIEEHHPKGKELWISLVPTIDFVLSHPNGWEGPQQSQMRSAAILAGLVPDTREGSERIHFVTEGEASLNFCISIGLGVDSLKAGHSLMVIDAGAGTIDISTYRQATRFSENKTFYEEASVPKCFLRGSVFVSQHAQDYLKDYFKGTRFARDVSHMVEIFDKTAKHKFKREEEDSFIRFGGSRDNLPAKSVRAGTLKLDGKIVAGFFQEALDCIIEAITEYWRESDLNTVFLVGGFSANDWVFKKAKEAIGKLGIDVCRPDKRVSKVIADGAVIYLIDNVVSVRKAKFSYGIESQISYNPLDKDHRTRKSQMFCNLEDTETLSGCFSEILGKNTFVSDTEEFRQHFLRLLPSKEAQWCTKISITILIHRGQQPAPKFIDEDPGNFESACEITADLSVACQSLFGSRNPRGELCYKLYFEVILLFGKTELKAQIVWKENGVERRGPAKVMSDTWPNSVEHCRKVKGLSISPHDVHGVFPVKKNRGPSC